METKERILSAAAAVFSRYGYRQTNMELVADEASLSRQGLYRHFASKEALFVATTEEMHRRSLIMAQAEATAAERARGDGVDTLVAAVCGRIAPHLHLVATSPHQTELMTEQNRLCGEVILTYRRQFMTLLSGLVETARKSGRLALPTSITAQEFAEDIMTIALGVREVLPPGRPDLFQANLRRIVRRVSDGACSQRGGPG
jgi:AcrR family transcriptional regulator